jgi:membrane-associated phospholipid phosphatase
MIIIRIVLLVLGLGHSYTALAISLQTFVNQTVDDYQYYYRGNLLPSTALLFGTSGISANTPLDTHINHSWQPHRTTVLNKTLDPFNMIGGAKIFIPFYFLFSFTDSLYESETTHAISLWGNHAARIIILGGPQQAVFTHFLGSQRPEQGDSHWHLFKGKRAVSGHAFYGAAPLLSLAKNSDTPWVRYTFYTLSTLPGVARLNQNKHYFSQVLAGWGLAYLSSKTVQQTSKQQISYAVVPENHFLLFSARLKF